MLVHHRELQSEIFPVESLQLHEANCFFLAVEEQAVCVSANTVGVF